MFNTSYDFYDMLETLELETIKVYHNDKSKPFILNEDCSCQLAVDTLYELCDYCVEFEGTDSVGYFFRFDVINDFYELCRQHARVNNIKFKRDPYVKDATDFIYQQMCQICDYAFVWNLWAPKKIVNKKSNAFFLELNYEFMNYKDMIEAIYTIKDYYAEKADELRKLLYKEVKKAA